MNTFGSDPEFMLADGSGGLKSAIGVVRGTSDDRVHVGKNAYYHDNVLAECAIEPATSREDAIEKFRACFFRFAKMVHPYKLLTRASADYPVCELSHPLAKVIGCTEEECGYEITPLEKPVGVFQTGTLRTAGGHVHIGDVGQIREDQNVHYYAKMLDLFLGVTSLYMDHDPTSARRRSLYGIPGSHRRKPYGIEYRVLGNFWLSSPKLVGIVFDLCDWTTKFVNDGGHFRFWSLDQQTLADCFRQGTGLGAAFKCLQYDAGILRKAIRESDLSAAREFMSIVRFHLPKRIYNEIEEFSRPASYDFYREWNL